VKTVDEIAYKYKAYQAAYILTNSATKEIIAEFDESLYKLFELDEEGLEIAEKKIDSAYQEFKTLYGVIGTDEKMIEYATGAFLAGENRCMMLPKYFIKTLFTNYSHVNSKFSYLPEHALIAIEPGLNREKQGEFEVFEIESSLFEDMCALYNEYVKKEVVIGIKKTNKAKDALMRATLIAAFNLLESYLNGIAFDYYLENKSKLSEENIEKLTEKKKDGKSRYLSLRDKIINYPRIILSAVHPIFDETNCIEAKRIIQIAKEYRDSIVHPSPYCMAVEDTPNKIDKFYGLTGEDTLQFICDVISIIKKIDKTIHPDHSRLSWIFDLGEDGLFSDEVFN
jgi:hypothetical protein